MKRIALASLVLLLVSGCRAPMPSFNPLAPLGSTRVPPPGTGTIGTNGNYYTPPTRPTTTPAIGTGFRPSPTTNKWSKLDDPSLQPIASKGGWSPTRTPTSAVEVVRLKDLEVSLANYEVTTRVVPTATVIERQGPIRIFQSNSTDHPSRSTLRGMPVRAATTIPVPRSFVPPAQVVDISEAADRGSDRAVSSQSNISSAKSDDTASSGGWQSRT